MNYQIGIYLLLPKEWEEVIGEIKRSLLPISINYTIPHLSLYSCVIKKEDFEIIVNQLKNINRKPFSITLSKVNVNIDDGYYFLDVPLHDELLNLHKEIINIVNPIRKGLIRQKDIDKIENGFYSDKQINYINKYGHARVLDLFKPHITFGISKISNHDKLTIDLSDKVKTIKSKSFEVKEITVGLFEEKDNRKIIEKVIKLEDYDMV